MLHQLDYREADGGRLEVELRWDDVRDEVSVRVRDGATGRVGSFVVHPQLARMAFMHPFVYAPEHMFPEPVRA
jgi:hypothetical protein